MTGIAPATAASHQSRSTPVGQGDVRELGTGLREQTPCWPLITGAPDAMPLRSASRPARSPDQLDHDVDVVALDQAAGIAGDQVVREEGLL